MAIASFYFSPIDDLPQFGEMSGAAVLIVEVVGVFPDVEGEQRGEAFGDGVVGAGLLGDDQGAVFLCGEPYPTTAEETDAFGFELGFEGIEGAPLLLDLLNESAAGDVDHRCGGTKLGEVEVVVEDLAGIVEDGAFGVFHDVFEGQVFHAATGEEFVEVVHVALQMFSIMKSERLGAYYWVQSIDFVR